MVADIHRWWTELLKFVRPLMRSQSTVDLETTKPDIEHPIAASIQAKYRR
jgi:hypothetical protein